MRGPFRSPSFPGTLLLAGAAILALFAADTFLAKIEQAESRAQADRLFREGQTLLSRGDSRKAMEKFKGAISAERGNRQYRLSLAEVQIAAGDTTAARDVLNGLLQSDPGDGRTNLLMARVLRKEENTAPAISYYRRAIYGQWQPDPAQSRLAVRYELIDLLARQDAKQDLLAELLPLDEQAPHDVATRLRIGRLFLTAGTPTRAAEVFREILHDHPADAGAQGGLGQAEFDQGHYRIAQRHLQAALRLSPADATLQRSIGLCDELLHLDPTLRGLGPAERYRRSVKLLALVAEEAGRCVGPASSPDLRELTAKAREAADARVRPARYAEVAEANLDVAEQLWQARRKECTLPLASDSPLALVLARLAQ